ncbi:MAG: sugar-binding transcriptional regulator, partial [Anaerolineae bacterium]|nr:sugar-binding transcriptional regulator [Anaerolineae bacterium]
ERIVQVTIIPPFESNVELERELAARYWLDEAVIVTPSSYDKTVLTHALGSATADYLLRCLQGDEILSVSWGTTLLSVIEALSIQNWPEMKIVQMLGGLGRPESETYGTDLVHRLALAFNAKPRLVPAPGIVNSKLVRDALLLDSQIAGTLALAAQADVALVGIGRPTPDSVVMQSGILTEAEFTELQACGAVGDIALRFFDSNGLPIQHEICDRMIGLDLDQIRNIPRVIGAAGGEAKVEVIRAALRGKLINILVTDERTALNLLEDPINIKEYDQHGTA